MTQKEQIAVLESKVDELTKRAEACEVELKALVQRHTPQPVRWFERPWPTFTGGWIR